MRALTLELPLIISLVLLAIPNFAIAHCDTLGGPVIADARAAIEKGDVTPVLKWVKNEDESAIKEMFRKTLAARKSGPEAKELSDMYFFETLVRIHRAGEGAPYTGLKPEGEVEPAVEEADKAIASGSVDKLVGLIADAVEDGIRERFKRVMETKKHAGESVAEGRKFVEAYVTFTHYVEALHMTAASAGAHHGEAEMKHEMPMHEH